jgi:hypothetical protein
MKLEIDHAFTLPPYCNGDQDYLDLRAIVDVIYEAPIKPNFNGHPDSWHPGEEETLSIQHIDLVDSGGGDPCIKEIQKYLEGEGYADLLSAAKIEARIFANDLDEWHDSIKHLD